MRAAQVTVLVLAGVLLMTQREAWAAPMGTAFTYQGHLEDGSGAVTAVCDFEFSLWDADVAGNAKGTSPQSANGVDVEDGLFTVTIDFGSGAFNGDARWLGIRVCCPTTTCSLETLDPRVELAPAPHALALPGLWTRQQTFSPSLIGGYSGNIVGGGLNGATIGGGGLSGEENEVTGHYGTVGGGSDNTASGAATISGGQGNSATSGWNSIGGGRDNQTAANYTTVSGGQENQATFVGATVGGGFQNTASGDYATVDGGKLNTAIGAFATIGGGFSNAASAGNATVGGGVLNTASDSSSTVGGGGSNTASGIGSTVGGGQSNEATGTYSTVPGGLDNTALGSYSFAAGRRAKANHDGAFVWGDSGNADCTSAATDEFRICAAGGVEVEGNLHATGTITSGSSITIDGLTDTITASSGTISFDDTDLITAGLVESTVAGFKFPDGSVQTTGATGSQWTTSGVDISYTAGNVGIGTNTPDALLHVNGGSIKIVDGTQGVGKVLTSDADGAASWQAPAAPTISGSFYRWATFSTYSQSSGWMAQNNPALFGGVHPSTWTDGNGAAAQISSDKDVLRTLFTRKGYAGDNAMVYANEWYSFSSTNGRVAAALFRIRNTTGGDIVWTVTAHHTAYVSWGERASVALNGVAIYNSGGATLGGGSPPIVHNLTIPANRTSTAIFISASSSPSSTRTCLLAFSNDSLALPTGLEYMDDLDTAIGGWEQ